MPADAHADATPADGPFGSMDAYLAIPRCAGLAVSADGARVVTTVAELDGDRARQVPALWELDLGGGPARRLTRSEKGERSPVFAADGSLLFVSGRPRPGGGDDAPAALWRLPAGGGEAWPVAAPAGGIAAVAAATAAAVVVFTARVAPGRQAGSDDDATWRDTRKQRKVTAVLHQQMPVRHWDHERGPEEVHLFAATLPAEATGGQLADVRDLTPDAALALLEAAPVVSHDGAFVVTDWHVDLPGGAQRTDLVRIDVATGERRVLASDPTHRWYYDSPAVSPGGQVACIASAGDSLTESAATFAVLVDPAGDGLDGAPAGVGDGPADGGPAGAGGGPAGAGGGGRSRPRRLDLGDLWPRELAWQGDGRLLVAGDRGGHAPLVAVDVATGAATDIAGDGAWHAPAGAAGDGVVALRSHVDSPPRPVLVGADGTLVELDAPGAVAVPGRLEDLRVTVADGTTVRAWLVLPEGAGPDEPAPLAVWVHGGPLGSWNDWSWRWNPWLMAARGWAVVLPDPAYSTGYGAGLVERGWRQWGGNPFTDVMAVTDAAEAHPAVDPGRTVAMGGSYGGYMANWIAGHTDRFRAIVSHASIWNLEQFQPTTDAPYAWADEWGMPADDPAFYRQWSPDAHVDAITTPMLVIHGAFDFRCPISESLRLFNDLAARGKEAMLLTFPDEHHWILQPGDAAAWYEAVWAFLDHHALGRPWRRPDLL
ncbi:MAG TPA: S9 family peptidase [Acidimicrobiales bacterium]|nr:S9 family peptidase [Acidimicrobiales bacterium]